MKGRKSITLLRRPVQRQLPGGVVVRLDSEGVWIWIKRRRRRCLLNLGWLKKSCTDWIDPKAVERRKRGAALREYRASWAKFFHVLRAKGYTPREIEKYCEENSLENSRTGKTWSAELIKKLMAQHRREA